MPVRDRFRIFRRIIFAIFLLMFTMFLGALFSTMNDEVHGNGTVQGIREYAIKSLVSARTSKILRFEGDEVQLGEVLIAFDDRNQQDKIAGLKNEVRELELQIDAKEKALALLRKDPLPAYYRHTRLQLTEARERLERSAHELEVYRELYDRKVITRKEFLKVELDHLSNRMTVQRLEEDWKKLQSGMASEIIARAEDELQLLRQKLAGKRGETAIAVRHLEDYLLRAPDAGMLTDSPPRPGGYYEKGEIVVKFAANKNKKVVALIDEKQIFKVEPGQEVRIYCRQYNYLDYGYFTGKVDVIYQLPVPVNGINHYPVKIVLTYEPQPLRFGSSCEVTIITGRERIIFALLGIRSKDFLTRRYEHHMRRKAAKKLQMQQRDRMLQKLREKK